jgi:hypothetical protein
MVVETALDEELTEDERADAAANGTPNSCNGPGLRP